ncbi:OprD family porin [Pseudomonas sp. LRF_L74]|uniref:OprD family porin n=1 Tax=Pseudomonas sp. LRF_L74 TaxID=3369422 RepID=UPI003F614505
MGISAPLFASLLASGSAHADFIDDSSGSLELRNFYMNRDFRQQGAAQSQAGSWSQAFMLRMQSGFTEGPVGFGLDAMGLLGVKLDSGRGRSGDGTLPFGPNSKRPVDDYSHAGLTAKIRYSKSQLNVGILTPTLPVVFRDDARLMPQTFDGALLESREIEGLTLTAGQLWKSRTRESAGSDNMYIGGRSAAFDSDEFNLAGATYAFTPNLSATYFYGELKDFYQQHYVGLLHTLPLGEGVALVTDARYFDSSTEGAGLAGSVDNRNFNVMSTLKTGGHRFGLAYQRMSGADAFPTLNGYTPPYTANLVTVGTFTSAKETSWQARYDYDFAAVGIPGLSLMGRYIKGSGIERGAGLSSGREWERDIDLAYVIQSGPLEGVGLKWRNAVYRTSYTSDIDETRIFVTYTMKLW